MITAEQLTEAGVVTRTHGTRGEIQIDPDLPAPFFVQGRCLVAKIDGIFVPFFIGNSRPKGEMMLLDIDGIDDTDSARMLTGKTLYALSRDLPEDDSKDDGVYLDDLEGYDVTDIRLGALGRVARVDFSTANALLILDTPGGHDLFIPAAPGIITDIDTVNRIISTDLPEGLADLNR